MICCRCQSETGSSHSPFLSTVGLFSVQPSAKRTGCDHTGCAVGRINGWPHFIATGEKPDPKVVEAVRYFDAVNFITRAKADGIITVGFIDTTCAPTSVYAAYNAVSGKKEIFNDVKSGHANTPKAGEAMREAILAHVEAMKKNKN